MIKLYNVIDTRTGMRHSEVIVKASKRKWFIPAPVEEEEETGE